MSGIFDDFLQDCIADCVGPSAEQLEARRQQLAQDAAAEDARKPLLSERMTWAEAARGDAERNQALREEVERLQKKVNELRAALIDAEEALDHYADADCAGDPPEYIPNRAMKAQGVVRAALWGRDL